MFEPPIILIDDINMSTNGRSMSASQHQTTVPESNVLPYFGCVGTGGVVSMQFVKSRNGYNLLWLPQVTEQTTDAPYAASMQAVKDGFGRTMSYLPAVFGVSRQTLYNWLKGETPKAQHRDKLMNLAAAARVFTENGFKPTAQSLQRTITQGRAFIELIGQGADGQEIAERLIRIERHGAIAQAKLNALLGDRTPVRPDVSDMGCPALNENS